MTNTKTLYERIKAALDDMSTPDLIEIYNNYCDVNHGYDSHIYSMDEFDEIADGMTPTDIAQRIFYGDFKPCDDYFTFNGYANFESFDFADDTEHSGIYTSDIAAYIERTEDSLENDDLQEIIDEYNEELEEEEEEEEEDEDDTDEEEG